MKDFSDPQADAGPAGANRLLDVQTLNSLNAWGLVSYILHLLVALSAAVPGAQASPLLLLVAVAIDLFKRSDAAGSWHASHFRWRLRSVAMAALLYLLTAPLWLLFVLPGLLAWLAVSIWFLYRIVCGLLALNKGQPMSEDFP